LQAHAIGVQNENAEMKTNKPGQSASSTSGSVQAVRIQKIIESTTGEQTEDAIAYRRLMNAVYTLVVNGQPLSAFHTVVSCLKANGVKLIDGYDNAQKARQFTACLAKAARAKVASSVQNATAFGILCDGSQVRETGAEKQLILVRVVGCDGKSKYYVAGLQDAGSIESASAENLKKAVDDTMMNDLGVDEEVYRRKLVSITVDGESACSADRTGSLFDQMAADGRPWLVGIRCVLHRVELAIRDSLLRAEMFNAVNDLTVALHTLTNQSAGFRDHFGATALELGVRVLRFANVRGSRSVRRQRRGLEVLLHNWVPLLVAVDKSLETGSHRTVSAELVGIGKQLADARVLAAACLLKLLLDVVARLSLKFHENTVQPFDVKPSVEMAVGQLEELLTTGDSPIETQTAAKMTLLDTVLQVELVKPGKSQKHFGLYFIN